MNDSRTCNCFGDEITAGWGREMLLHDDVQDTGCEAWDRLLKLIEDAARDGRETFSPSRELGPEVWGQIVELPREIGILKRVKKLDLYGSSVVRIPPEIGEMTALEEFDPYTSYRLHWFPYEITRCRHLKRSRVSTRALYGNWKFRPPFPRLPHDVANLAPRNCSVCDQPMSGRRGRQRWISRNVATDVLPLLVHACSDECVANLPAAAQGYLPVAHQGGIRLMQPVIGHPGGR